MITISGFWILMLVAALALVAAFVLLLFASESTACDITGSCLVILFCVLLCSIGFTAHLDKQTWTEKRPITSAIGSEDGSKWSVEYPDGTTETVGDATVWRDGGMFMRTEHHRIQWVCWAGPTGDAREYSSVELHVQEE